MPLSQKTLQKYLAELRRIEKHRTVSAEKNIRRIYKALVKDLNGFLGNEYVTYGENGVLNVSMLQEKLRYARFLEEIEAKLNGVSFETAKIIRELVEQTYSAVYVGMVEAVKQSEYGETLAPFLNGMSLRPEVIKRAIENPVSGLTLPDVLEKRRKEVIYDIKQQVNIGLMNGDRYSDVAKKITERVDINYRKAITTVRTESHRVIEGGLHDSALDVMEAAEGSGLIYTKRWQTMKDERVRPQMRRKTKKGWKTYRSSNNADHMKMDGVVIKVDELFDLGGGVTTTAPGQSGLAGQDINCRCMLVYEWMTLEELATVTHDSADVKTAEEYYNYVVKSEPQITKDLKAAVEGTNGKLEGLAFKLKTKDSYIRKVSAEMLEVGLATKEAVKNMRDVVRYTCISGVEDLTNDYAKIMKTLSDKGYQVMRVKNTFKQGKVYKGINVIFQNRQGVNFELQFHTPQSFKLKNGELHKLYEKQRLTSTADSEKKALANQMKGLSNKIELPNNINTVKDINKLK